MFGAIKAADTTQRKSKIQVGQIAICPAYIFGSSLACVGKN